MSAKKNLYFLLMLVVSVAGCNLLADRQPPPNVETVPPYWQSQNELEELRAFHDKEADKISAETEDVHIVRNAEMERLETAQKELEKDKLWQDDYEKTLERREKWFGWFNKGDKEVSENVPALSSNADGTNGSGR